MNALRSKGLQGQLLTFSVVCFAAGAWLLYKLAQVSLPALSGVGWAENVGATGSREGLFGVLCIFSKTCRPVLWERFGAEVWFIPFLIALAAFVITLLGAFVVSFFSDVKPGRKDPGGRGFLTDRELHDYIKEDKDPSNPRLGYYGYTESGRQLKARRRDRCAHTALFAGTGGGKTTRIIKPSILQDALDGVAVMMIDPKWPDPEGGFSDTLEIFKNCGYDVQTFCPFEEHTLKLPLIDSLRSHADAEVLASTIIPKITSGEASEGAKFYKDQQRELLTHLLWGEAHAGRRSMGAIYDLIDGGPAELTRWLMACKDPKIQRSMGGTTMQVRHDTLIGIIQGLKNDLRIFTNERLDASTQGGLSWQNLDIQALTERKSVLYVGIPQQMFLRGEGKLLLNLFFRRIMDQILGIAEEQGGKLKQHLAVYIDEFAHVGKLENAGSWFATMRSFNIAFTIVLQNRAQLEAVYGTIEAKSMAEGNVQHLITFPASLRGEDREHVSRMLGKIAVTEDSKGNSSQEPFEYSRRTTTTKTTERLLLAPEEMSRWDPNYGVLIPKGGGATRVAAPQVRQRRVGGVPLGAFGFGGVKNDFYRFNSVIGGGDSVELVKRLLRYREQTWREPEPPLPAVEAERAKPRRSTIEPIVSVEEPEEVVLTEEEKREVLKAQKEAAEIAEAVVKGEALPVPPEGQAGQSTAEHVKVVPSATIGLEAAEPAPSEEEATASEPSPMVTPPVVVKPEKEAPHKIPSGELMPEFREWIDTLESDVPLTIYRNGKKRVSKISFDSRPEPLRHEHLSLWKQRRWIHFGAEHFSIVGTGCNVLSPEKLEAMMNLPQTKIIDSGEGDQGGVVKEPQAGATLFTPGALENPKVKARLKAWVAENGSKLDRHPDVPENAPLESLIGRYEPRAFLVDETYLAGLSEVSNEMIEALPSTRRKLAGELVMLREVSEGLIAKTPALEKFHHETHRLEGHPDCKNGETPIGIFQHESVYLPKAQCELATELSFERVKTEPQKIGYGEKRRQLRGVKLSLYP